MPTGYTAALCDGDQSFEDFALQCARAFGACAMQRDDDFSDKPKLRENDTYHTKQLARAQKHLTTMKKMSKDRRIAFGQRHINEEKARYVEMIAKGRETANRLNHMVTQVLCWTPPTPDHANLKTFMLEQLRMTIDHDGDTSYYENELEKLATMSPLDVYNQHLESAKWDVNYHIESLAREEARTEGANDWIIKLYDSLGLKPNNC